MGGGFVGAVLVGVVVGGLDVGGLDGGVLDDVPLDDVALDEVPLDEVVFDAVVFVGCVLVADVVGRPVGAAAVVPGPPPPCVSPKPGPPGAGPVWFTRAVPGGELDELLLLGSFAFAGWTVPPDLSGLCPDPSSSTVPTPRMASTTTAATSHGR